MTIVLGIEGTAWNFSAAIVNENDVITEVTNTYAPEKGGIHPRDASQHHAKYASITIKNLLKNAKEKGVCVEDIDGIAFSIGPGLGPCLRTVATTARMLSLLFEIPLIGVNHCLAHIEVGKWKTHAKDPITLYVSGANSQILGIRDSKYRIFGETLDIGLGNAFDKFARSVGLSHPGGPKVEKYAKNASTYIPLPYSVKGMDFSFSGLTTAAIDSLKDNRLEDVCYSFQETAFAMLVEVTERALAHTGKNEVLLAGGVGANMRLREMLDIMCKDRGASFFVPENRFMGDNGAMIAYLGLLMLNRGDVIKIEDSRVNPNFRPDAVTISWDSEEVGSRQSAVGSRQSAVGSRVKSLSAEFFNSGAEATVELKGNTIIKKRVPKGYRIKELDERIRRTRTKREAQLISESRRRGIPTPIIQNVLEFTIEMEYIDGNAIKEVINTQLSEKIGELIGKLHEGGIVHGDLTTSNMILHNDRIYLIDFGLGSFDKRIEAQGVDICVLFRTYESTHKNYEKLIDAFCNGYKKTFKNADEVLKRVDEIKKRGRYI